MVRASVGITTACEPGGDLLRDADLAMYQAKAQGRNRAVLFDCAMHSDVVARLAMERDLRGALERDELRLVFQPIVDLADGSVGAAEALLRWHSPARGLVSPADFVPLAEETGMIVPIGAWVLERRAARRRNGARSR